MSISIAAPAAAALRPRSAAMRVLVTAGHDDWNARTDVRETDVEKRIALDVAQQELL